MSEPLPDLIEEVISASNDEGCKILPSIVASKDEDELALLLESLPLEQRIDVWNNIQPHKKLDVLIACSLILMQKTYSNLRTLYLIN